MNLVIIYVLEKYDNNYTDYYKLVFINKDKMEVLHEQYFDVCEPYISPNSLMGLLSKLGVNYEVIKYYYNYNERNDFYRNKDNDKFYLSLVK